MKMSTTPYKNVYKLYCLLKNNFYNPDKSTVKNIQNITTCTN